MMTELWWKAFLAALITVIAVKLFGCKQGVFLLFSISFIAWAFGLILFAVAGEWAYSVWKKVKGKMKR